MKKEEERDEKEPKVEEVDESLLINELRLFATLSYCG